MSGISSLNKSCTQHDNRRASKHRSVASTNLNRASSRSHAILTITVTISDPVENKSQCLLSRLVFSMYLLRNDTSSLWKTEPRGLGRVREQQGTRVPPNQLSELNDNRTVQMTGNDPSRMAESSAINKSLSVLGQVVHAINQGAVRSLTPVISLARPSYYRHLSDQRAEFRIGTRS